MDMTLSALSHCFACNQLLPYNTFQYDACQYDASQYDASQYDASQYDAFQYDASQYDASPWNYGNPVDDSSVRAYQLPAPEYWPPPPYESFQYPSSPLLLEDISPRTTLPDIIELSPYRLPLPVGPALGVLDLEDLTEENLFLVHQRLENVAWDEIGINFNERYNQHVRLPALKMRVQRLKKKHKHIRDMLPSRQSRKRRTGRI